MAKKKKEEMQCLLYLMLPAMYAGAGRHLITFDGKKKFIKIAQVQELLLHTVPLCALIFYNSSADSVHYHEAVDTTAKVFFCISLALNLIEIIVFQLSMGTNLDPKENQNVTKRKPRRNQ